ncbi:MAG: SRPBCC family protein [Bacteroidetes bacterium]|nr:SRPBCC family protein [Bacteroidota bacterium]
MRILKNILVALVVLVLVLLVVALFVDKDYTITREITINKPKSEVFNYVKFLKNQNEYSKWAKMDPNMKKDFRGTDATVGFVSAWEGNKDVGKGEQEIKKIADGERIDYEIRFIKPWESIAQAHMSTTAVTDNQTKVSWAFSGHMPYPMNIMRILGMEKMVGNDLQTGLDNLKSLLEK